MGKSLKSDIDTDAVRVLAELINETDLSEIEVEKDGFKIRVARKLSAPSEFTNYVPQFFGNQGANVPQKNVAVEAEVDTKSASKQKTIDGEEVTSPMVGTVYLSPGPDKDNFISVGDEVKKGQSLLIIEAMKTFNEIPSPRDGKVKAILVSSEQPVEFGEPLIVLE